jgi:hypothetical protein
MGPGLRRDDTVESCELKQSTPSLRVQQSYPEPRA